MEAANASMVAALCGTFRAFLGDAFNRFSGTTISAPCTGS
jgi:hypothetical protein